MKRNHIEAAKQQSSLAKWINFAVVLTLSAGLAACGGKEKKPGQSLVSVNGEEITTLQLNEELQRSGASAAQQEQASKQLLEALIDRQLLVSEANKEKIDRDPKILQAIERAKALILAQAYLQKHVGAPTKISRAEIEEYYQKNPGFFAERKVLDLRQLIIASRDLDDALKSAMDAAKNLDDVASYLDSHKIKYARAQASRATSELPPELSAKFLSMNKGQLFIIKEGERSILVALADVKDAPMSLDVAAGQIEQFLMNKKNKAASDAEVARLRATAKIEYLNKNTAADAAASAAASAPAEQAAASAPR